MRVDVKDPLLDELRSACHTLLRRSFELRQDIADREFLLKAASSISDANHAVGNWEIAWEFEERELIEMTVNPAASLGFVEGEVHFWLGC